jgi:hypothetical protein
LIFDVGPWHKVVQWRRSSGQNAFTSATRSRGRHAREQFFGLFGVNSRDAGKTILENRFAFSVAPITAKRREAGRGECFDYSEDYVPLTVNDSAEKIPKRISAAYWTWFAADQRQQPIRLGS